MYQTTMDTAMELSFWKEEPLSPVFSGLEADQADVWQLFEDEVAKQASPERDPLEDLGSHQVKWLPDSPDDSCDSLIDPKLFHLNTRAQLASQLLQDLDDVLIKEEPFSDWYETKTDLPMFEELPSPSKEEARPFAGLSAPAAAPACYAAFTPAAPAAVHVPLSVVAPPPPESLQPLVHPQHALILHAVLPAPAAAPGPAPAPHLPLTDTQTLLQEFECVFGKVEQSHGALTPPQSPPHDMAATFQRLAAPAQLPVHLSPPSTPLAHLPQLLPHEDFSGGLTPNPQLIAEVDEIVRSRVASWPDCRPPSPCTSSNSSFTSEDQSTSPPSPDSDDPDWTPAADPAADPAASDPAATSPVSPDDDSAPGPAPGKARKRAGKRSKPYGSNVEDKKLRKKEQNKNAATRYRMKKKAEVEVILGEENELKERNEQLQAKVQDLSQEIRYLKNLMRDVFRAKGLIK